MVQPAAPVVLAVQVPLLGTTARLPPAVQGPSPREEPYTPR
jgi:hypothetical protein